MTKKDWFIRIELQLQKPFFSLILKNKSLPSDTIILSKSSMACNTIAFLGKITCQDNVDFGKCQDRFGKNSWSKNDSNYSNVKLKVLKKDDNKEIQLVQKLTMREADFNQFIRLQSQLVLEAGNLCIKSLFFSSADTYNVQRHGWTFQTDSQGSWRSGPSKLKMLLDSVAVQCGQAGVFLRSSPITCKEEGGREVLTLSMWIKN